MSQPCEICGAVVPNPGKDSEGRTVCCIHCAFNPLGCRCQFGEFGVAETQQAFLVDESEDDEEW